jgi:hemerythrin-like domain-containing protein
MTPSQPFGAPAPGFDEPLEMLEACHGRIEAQLATLEKLVAHLERAGCDAQARQAADREMRYFDTAGINHHRDEDEDLFPVLRAAAAQKGSDVVAGKLYELEMEHESMDAFYARLRRQLEALLIEGSEAKLDAGDVERFAWVYRKHMSVESEFVLPFARETLTEAQRARLGASMAARRGAATMNTEKQARRSDEDPAGG